MRVISAATSVYIVMVLVFGAGLWAILQYGRLLQAPPDLAGDWQTIGDSPAKLTIQQSGRFVILVREGQTPIDVKLISQESIDGESPARAKLTMAEGDWSVTAEGPPRGDVYHFDVNGPGGTHDSFDAQRTRRLYPKRESDPPQPSSQPTTAASPPHARP